MCHERRQTPSHEIHRPGPRRFMERLFFVPVPFFCWCSKRRDRFLTGLFLLRVERRIRGRHRFRCSRDVAQTVRLRKALAALVVPCAKRLPPRRPWSCGLDDTRSGKISAGPPAVPATVRRPSAGPVAARRGLRDESQPTPGLVSVIGGSMGAERGRGDASTLGRHRFPQFDIDESDSLNPISSPRSTLLAIPQGHLSP